MVVWALWLNIEYCYVFDRAFFFLLQDVYHLIYFKAIWSVNMYSKLLLFPTEGSEVPIL